MDTHPLQPNIDNQAPSNIGQEDDKQQVIQAEDQSFIISIQNELSLAKLQNEWMLEKNEKLNKEVSLLNEKLQQYEDKIRAYEEYIQQLLNREKQTYDENGDDKPNLEGSQKTKKQITFSQILIDYQKNKFDDHSQSSQYSQENKYGKAQPKSHYYKKQMSTSPFKKQQDDGSDESSINNKSIQQKLLHHRLKDRAVTVPPKNPFFTRQKTLEVNYKQSHEQMNYNSLRINSGYRINFPQENVKQVIVEKTDQIVALGYEHLKQGSIFKPKAQISMMKEKRVHRGHNNSSQDVNFLMKEFKINTVKNNIEQKNNSQFFYEAYGENSDFFTRPREGSQGYPFGQFNFNQTQSDYPMEIKCTVSEKSESNQQDTPSSGSGCKNNSPHKHNHNPQNINIAVTNNSPYSNHSFHYPKLSQLQGSSNPQLINPIQNSKQGSANSIGINQNENLLNSIGNKTSSLNNEEANLRAIIEVNELDPETIKYERECQRFYQLYNDIKQFGALGDFLFEEFMLIGPDLKELQAQIDEQPSPFIGIKGANLEYTKGKVQQTILFNKPSYTSPHLCQKRQTIAQFAFPKGLQYYRYKSQADLKNLPSRFQDILLMNLCQQKESEDLGINDKMFVLNIRGEEENRNQNNSLSSINPNSILYAICYQQEDIYIAEDENTGEKTIFLFPVVYCFLTYYPFVDYFLQIMLEIVNRIKTVRLLKSSFSGIIDNNLKNVDLEQVLNTLNQDRDLCLSLKTLQIKDVQPERVISYFLNTPSSNLLCSKIIKADCNQNQELTFHKENERTKSLTTGNLQNIQFTTQSFSVPPLEDMGYIEGLEAAYLTFSNLPFIDFQIILSLIMLEKKVVFLSSNITLLTLTTLTFQTLFKPLKYPHPVIFSISDDLMYFLEAPVPIIVGINESAEQFELEFGYNSECYYVDLDKNFIVSKCQENISKLESEKYRFNKFKSQIEPLFLEINSEITSKQFGSTFKKLIKRSNHDKKLIYKPDNKQLENLKSLLQLIRKSFQESIISRLPNNPIFIDDNQSQLDMESIQKAVLKNNPESSFLRIFVETQIFNYYMEQRYY